MAPKRSIRPVFSGWCFELPPGGHKGLHLRARSSNDQESLADWLEGKGNTFTELTLEVWKYPNVAYPRKVVYLDKIVVHRESEDTFCSIREGELTISLTKEDGNRVANILRTIDVWNEDSIELDVDHKPTLLWFWCAG